MTFDQVNPIGKGTIVYPQGKNQTSTTTSLLPKKKKKESSKLTIDLNLKAKTTKLLEENMEYICDFGLGKNFSRHKKH